jgi:hypothetical protein
MTAALLHRAAEAERAEWGGSDARRVYPEASAIHLALADWLEKEETFVEFGWHSPHSEIIARLILGEPS